MQLVSVDESENFESQECFQFLESGVLGSFFSDHLDRFLYRNIEASEYFIHFVFILDIQFLVDGGLDGIRVGREGGQLCVVVAQVIDRVRLVEPSIEFDLFLLFCQVDDR